MRRKGRANEPLLFTTSDKAPFTVAYGMGVDSTAMLVGLVKHGIRPDLILFADTGAERPETYEYRPVFEEWLKKQGFPPITTVKYVPRGF
jgi:3'-phosphoadenosine 5'-phosphosulfate sulfotransferase (PAPS reductase)/FAD synthetase